MIWATYSDHWTETLSTQKSLLVFGTTRQIAMYYSCSSGLGFQTNDPLLICCAQSQNLAPTNLVLSFIFCCLHFSTTQWQFNWLWVRLKYCFPGKRIQFSCKTCWIHTPETTSPTPWLVWLLKHHYHSQWGRLPCHHSSWEIIQGTISVLKASLWLFPPPPLDLLFYIFLRVLFSTRVGLINVLFTFWTGC